MNEITKALLEKTNWGNALFQSKLNPTLDKSSFLGLKMPELKEIERRFRGSEEEKAFLKELPHRYFDENWLHVVMISELKDFHSSIETINAFLPFVDNWAVCDSLKPKSFKKADPKILISLIKNWISSKETYTCRFGIEMLMDHFLDERFKKNYLTLASKVRSDEYYVKMIQAWFFATALAKQWDSSIIVLENDILPTWVHNKTIQKAVESYRISSERKEYLKKLKRKG